MGSHFIYPVKHTLPEVLVVPERNNAAGKPALVGLDDSGSVKATFSYNQLLAAVGRLVENDFQRSRLNRGDTVVLLMPNSVEVAVVMLALLHRGLVVFPLNPALKTDEVGRLLDDVKPALVVTGTRNSEQVLKAFGDKVDIATAYRPNPEDATEMSLKVYSSPQQTSGHLIQGAQGQHPTPGDAAVLLFTSGTTGRPKGAVLTHANILVSCNIIATNTKLTSEDICMLITPMFHVAGLCASLLVTLLTGGTVIIPPFPPSPLFWQQIEDHKVTWFHAVPTLHRMLLGLDSFHESQPGETLDQRRQRACRTLRFARSGGSAISPALFAAVEKATDRPLVEIYGLTETSPGIFCNLVDSPVQRQPSVFPIPAQVELKVVQTRSGQAFIGPDHLPGQSIQDQGEETGEVWLRGPSIITKYAYGEPAQTALAFDGQGFFSTGDLARRISGQGDRIQLIGRVKEMINKAGEKISPQEVEDAILEHEKVKEAACFAAYDENFGEDICKCDLPYISVAFLIKIFRISIKRPVNAD